MDNTFKNVMIFIAGAAIGAVVAVQVVKDKYVQLAEEEIESVKEMYKNKYEKKEEVTVAEPAVEHSVQEEEKTNEYEQVIEDSGYVNYTKFMSEENKKEELVDDPYDTPFIIDYEEYGENANYDTMTLTYFADGVLVDDCDDIIDDLDIVGEENLKIFEEFDGATAIYVRNNIMMTDYEILKDDWNYSDIGDVPSHETIVKNEKKPHQL